MIIFGTRGVKFTKGEGQFECPQCASQQPYKHKSVRRFFTLYFIPLIPLDSLGEYVECRNCKGTFVPRVLDYAKDQQSQQNQFMSEYEKAVRQSMIRMMLADGVIDDNEMVTVQMIINKFSHNDVTIDELKALSDKIQNENIPVSVYLKKIAPQLNEHNKETLINAAMAVASADGHVDESEISFIYEMGEALDMSKSHLKGILSDYQQKQPSFSEN